MDFACLWRGADSSSNKQQKQTSKWQSANEGESVLCCIHSQLLIRFWDFLCLHGDKRLILQQRLPCRVGRLISAEQELALHSPDNGRIRGYGAGDPGAEAVLTNLSYELMRRYRAASTVAFGSTLLFQDTEQELTEIFFSRRHSSVAPISPRRVTAQVSRAGRSCPVSRVTQN